MRGTVCTIVLLALTGCTSTGAIAPNLGERLIADVSCLTALSAAGLAIYANPTIGATTAVSVLEKIHEVSTSNVPIVTLQACEKTIGFALQDAHGIAAKAKGAYTPQ